LPFETIIPENGLHAFGRFMNNIILVLNEFATPNTWRATLALELPSSSG
jgi:hypothetical protein